MTLTHGVHTEDIENFFVIVLLNASLEEFFDGTLGSLDGFGNLIDILRLDHGFEIILENLGEVVYSESVRRSGHRGGYTYSATPIPGSILRYLANPGDRRNGPGSA